MWRPWREGPEGTSSAQSSWPALAQPLLALTGWDLWMVGILKRRVCWSGPEDLGSVWKLPKKIVGSSFIKEDPRSRVDTSSSKLDAFQKFVFVILWKSCQRAVKYHCHNFLSLFNACVQFNLTRRDKRLGFLRIHYDTSVFTPMLVAGRGHWGGSLGPAEVSNSSEATW